MQFNAEIAFIVLGLCVVNGIAIGCVLYYRNKNIYYCLLGLCFGICVGLAIGNIAGNNNQKETEKYQYRVKIDDSILLSDFIKEYKIIDVESENILLVEKIEKNLQEEKDVNLKK